MSQYYPPPQGPVYPPPQNPEDDDYYYEEGDYEYEEIGEGEQKPPVTQLGLAFVGGGCLVFLCMSICAVLLTVLWFVDPGAGTEPPPGSDIGLSFEAPAFPDESVVNDQGVQLTILDVNRNASVEAIPPVESREVIVVTIELVNLGDADAEFSERDFMLINTFEEVYAPTVGAIVGSLGRGTLPPNEGLEGRMVFEVVAGELDLQLLWEPPGSTSRYIYLE